MARFQAKLRSWGLQEEGQPKKDQGKSQDNSSRGALELGVGLKTLLPGDHKQLCCCGPEEERGGLGSPRPI